MALTVGTPFAFYEIGEVIGTGGMGQVYRAVDTKLERDVAIKVLPESFAADENCIARFEREAKTLASLNHPNIAQIYGLETGDGTTALVMELVEGPTLADRIAQGPLPADEALNVAMQIADALEAAHEQGIVHRDLKPANVKLRSDGTVKVLDFGIAKALDADAAASGPQAPSLTTPAMTQAGILLGTAAYMSPEQARGKPVDRRTDIWAFGCVLYEMLTGQPAFGGEDVPLTLARVLSHDTDLGSVPGTVSLAVTQTIALCLEKDPKRRISDIRDVRLALEGAFETVPDAASAQAPAAAPEFWRRPLPVAAAALVVGAVITTAAAWRAWPAPEPSPVARFDFDVPPGTAVRGPGHRILALSPDGRRFVYNTVDGLFVRELSELEARLVSGTEQSLTNPFFSPDGRSVGYWAGGEGLKRIGISGGAPVTIAGGANPSGASWNEDGTILFAQPDGIYRVPANGGEPERLIAARGGERIDGPRLLADDDHVLFSSAVAGDWDAARVVVESLSTGERTVLVQGGSDAIHLPSGHLVYAVGDELFATALDVDRMAVSGAPVRVLQGLTRAGGDVTAAANYDVAADGTLVYLSASDVVEPRQTLSWVGRDGRDEDIGVEPCFCVDLSLAPDGSRAAVTVFSEYISEADVWIWSFESRTFTRLTFEPGIQGWPVWTPDSRDVVYASGGQGLVRRAADGTGAVEVLLEDSGRQMMPYSLSASGEPIVAWFAPWPQTADIAALTAGEELAVRSLLAEQYSEAQPTLSPDGRWLAYESNETGRKEIFVRPYPDVDAGKTQISDGGGRQPIWGSDGSKLYFLSELQLMEAEIETDPVFRRRTPEALVALDEYYLGITEGLRFYDVSADGERFLLLKPDASPETRVIIVQNWLDELERLVPID